MRTNKIRAVLGIVTACAWLLSACSGSQGAGNGADPAGQSTTAAADASASKGSAEEASVGNSTENTAPTGEKTQAGTGEPALIPLLVDRETRALHLGTYEWGGRIVGDGTVRRDALEARLRSMNETLAGKEDVAQVYVTRSDETAVSLVVCRTTEPEGVLQYDTYVLQPETGKDLRLTDVVADTKAFAAAFRQAAEEQLPQEDILSDLASDQEVMDFAGEHWTLDYEGLTVYPPEAVQDAAGNIPCVAVGFEENGEAFQQSFLSQPVNYMVQMLPGRTYVQEDAGKPVRVDHGEAVQKNKVAQYPYTLTFGERSLVVYQVRNYPDFYMVRVGEKHFVLADLPHLETTYLTDSHTMALYDPESISEGDQTGDTLVRYGLADQGAFDSSHVRLFDDAFSGDNPLMLKFGINSYAYYSINSDGTFEREEPFWYLDGPEREAVRQIDTLGYRLYDTEALVSKQITRGMLLAPYRTDGETFLEFVGNGDVFRFEIDGLDENTKLNGVYTLDMLFGS